MVRKFGPYCLDRLNLSFIATEWIIAEDADESGSLFLELPWMAHQLDRAKPLCGWVPNEGWNWNNGRPTAFTLPSEFYMRGFCFWPTRHGRPPVFPHFEDTGEPREPPVPQEH